MCVGQNRVVMLEMEELCACKEDLRWFGHHSHFVSVSWSSFVTVFNVT